MSDEEAIRADERERLSARVYENGWCPTCGTAPKCERCNGTGSLAPRIEGLLNFIKCPDCDGGRAVPAGSDGEDR